MRNNIWNIVLVVFVIVMFVGVSIIPSISGNIHDKNETYTRVPKFSSNIEWWPMFHHDTQRTGHINSVTSDNNKTLSRHPPSDTTHSLVIACHRRL